MVALHTFFSPIILLLLPKCVCSELTGEQYGWCGGEQQKKSVYWQREVVKRVCDVTVLDICCMLYKTIRVLFYLLSQNQCDAHTDLISYITKRIQ